MKLIPLTAVALMLSLVSVSAGEDCIEKDGKTYCANPSVEVVVLGPDGQKLEVNRPPAADAVAYCAAKGGEIKMDISSPTCTQLPNGGYENCDGACFNKVTGAKIDG